MTPSSTDHPPPDPHGQPVSGPGPATSIDAAACATLTATADVCTSVPIPPNGHPAREGDGLHVSIPIVVLLLLCVLAIAGAVAGVVVIIRRGLDHSGRLEADPTSPRVSAEVHAGEEQVLIHLARSLALPSDRDDVGYGEIYVAGSAGMTMKLASRSEIGRGFDAEVRVQRTRQASIAEYYILRLPGDDALHARIAGLDDEIARALRALDPQAQIRLRGRPAPA
jgi:hypothetical protein